jgi:hypothetical protein
MATRSEKKDWQSIAEEASKETNPEKLLTLVRQLCSALDDSKKEPAPLTGQRKHADRLDTSSTEA